MTRIVVACGVLGLWLGTGSAACRCQEAPRDDSPALAPPALEPPATTPDLSRPAQAVPATVPRPVRPSQNPALLLIPGVTAPAPGRPANRPPSTSPAAAAAPGRRPAPNVLTLEPITEDLDDEPARPAPADRPARPPRPRDSAPPSEARREPRATSPPSGRPAPSGGTPGLLGRLLLPGATSVDPTEPRSSITVEPRSDPAADAAVKRRIEKQIEQTLGNRVRSVEVLVTGRSVVLRARAARFWYRRGVRHSLETLPLPAGYRARVEMLD